MRKLFPVMIVVIFFVACEAPTKITKSWHDPNTTVDAKSLNKVLVFALVKDETARHSIEDKLVSLMKVKGVQSYNYLTDDMMKDSIKLNEKLKADGFNGVLIMRLVDVEKETNYVPGSGITPGYYGGYYGYYRYGGAMYSNPGYYQTDKHYNVETQVYSTVPDKLVWSATTRTVNPDKFDKTIEEIAGVIVKKMKEDGFLIDKQ